MPSVNHLYCCGWKEIAGLSNYAGNFDAVMVSLLRTGHIRRNALTCGAFIFTEAHNRKAGTGYATRFAADVKTRKLGKIEVLPVFRNPNTDHYIRSFMWMPSRPAVHKYLEAKGLYNQGGVW